MLKRLGISIIIASLLIFFGIEILNLTNENTKLKNELLNRSESLSNAVGESTANVDSVVEVYDDDNSESMSQLNIEIELGYQPIFFSALSGDSYEKLAQNPIDKQLELEFEELIQSDNYSVASAAQIYETYLERWRSEMILTYERLTVVLKPDFISKLEKSQDDWENYFTNSGAFNDSFISNLYDTGDYGATIILESNKFSYDLIRKRTLLLKEILLIVADEVQFSIN